eukprot:g9556.t1
MRSVSVSASIVGEASQAAASDPCPFSAACPRPQPRTGRRVRPRSRLPSPPSTSVDSSPAFLGRNLRRRSSRGAAAVSLSTPAAPAPGVSMPLFLSLLAVSAGAAPAPAAAAADVAALSSPWTRFSSFSATTTATTSGTTRTAAFCFPAKCRNRLVITPEGYGGGGGLRPSLARRLRRRSAGAALSAAAAAPGRSISLGRCLLPVGSMAPPPFSLRRFSRLGGALHPRWAGGGGGGGGGGGHIDRAAPLSRVCSMVGLGHTDEWGSGSTEETNYGYGSEQDDGPGAPVGAGAGAVTDWDDGEWDDVDVEFPSSFGLAGDSGDGHGGAPMGTWGDGAAGGTMAPSLAERDAARLEEVGMMVRELEEGAASTVAGVGAGAGAGAGTKSASRQPRSSRQGGDAGGGVDGGHTAAERRSEFVGGMATGNAHLRMTCGDPVFFGELADLMRGLYRQSGGRKFLTHEEEMALGAKVQRYRRLIEAQEKAEKEDGRRPPLREVAKSSAGLPEDEFAAVMQEGMEARQKLVVCNLALVVSLSNKYKRSHFNCNCLQTLIQEGTIGLIRAAERYDPAKGFRFTTYAIWWIEARLRVSVQTEERMIHVPMWVKNKYNIVSRSIPKLRETLGREPTCEEIAAQVDIDTKSKVMLTPKRVKELQMWVAFHRKHESLDMPVDVGTRMPLDCSTIEHGVKAPEPSLESTSELEIQRDFLESCLAQDLSRIQRKILRMKVGLGGEKGKNRQEISRALKMPFNNVISEERKAFYKLRGLQRGGEYPSFEELK